MSDCVRGQNNVYLLPRKCKG